MKTKPEKSVEEIVERMFSNTFNQPENESYLVNVPVSFFKKQLTQTLQVERQAIKEALLEAFADPKNQTGVDLQNRRWIDVDDIKDIINEVIDV